MKAKKLFALATSVVLLAGAGMTAAADLSVPAGATPVWSESFATLPDVDGWDWVNAAGEAATFSIVEVPGFGSVLQFLPSGNGHRGFARFFQDPAIANDIVTFTFDINFGDVTGTRNNTSFVIATNANAIESPGHWSIENTTSVFRISKFGEVNEGVVVYGSGFPWIAEDSPTPEIPGYIIDAPGFSINDTWFGVVLVLDFGSGEAHLQMTNRVNNHVYSSTVPLYADANEIEVIGLVTFRAGGNPNLAGSSAQLANLNVYTGGTFGAAEAVPPAAEQPAGQQPAVQPPVAQQPAANVPRTNDNATAVYAVVLGGLLAAAVAVVVIKKRQAA